MTFVYDYYKRKSSKILWGIEGPSLWRVIEAPLCIFINAVVVLTITYVTSSFSGLKKNREYVVADKKAVVQKMTAEEVEGVIQEVKIAQPEEEKASLLVKWLFQINDYFILIFFLFTNFEFQNLL